jgi:hypothetical protein
MSELPASIIYSQSEVNEIDRICDDFELAWGTSPKISEHSKGILAEIADAVSARVERALAEAAQEEFAL